MTTERIREERREEDMREEERGKDDIREEEKR